MYQFEITKFYDLIWERNVTEIKSVARFYKHKKTQAEVLVLENDDTNVFFGIGFTTLPDDSTGVAHILEHAVLNGSAKYRVKEPFVHLVKTSLKTFLNALTWPDKTVYPVASQNEEDLHNLMDVYLDAVFHPLITPNILKQEGWHYELRDPKEPIKYKGVVFNEMKGSNSDPNVLTEKFITEALFPDTLYRHDSGGNPAFIPTLTHEKFKSFHEKYYHPSNSMTLLYGKQDFARSLEHLNIYFQEYDYRKFDDEIELQKPFEEPKLISYTYPVSPDENSEKKHIAVSGWVLGHSKSPEERVALEILTDILLESEASPLKRALIESGLGDDLAGNGLDLELRQDLFYTGLKGVHASDVSKVHTLIRDTLKNLVQDGINPSLINATINKIDFVYREGTFQSGNPKNVTYFRMMLTTWNYNLDPLDGIFFRKEIDTIKEKIENGEKYFETLIEKFFLNNSHQAHIHLTPDPNYTKQKEEEERKTLENYKNSLSETEIKTLIEETNAFDEWQKMEDSEAELAKLPVLTRSDIKEDLTTIEQEESYIEEQQLLFNNVETNGISYIDVGFDLLSIPQEKWGIASFIANILVKLGTKNHSYEDIAIILNTETGGIRSRVFSSGLHDDPNRVIGKIFFRTKILQENTQKGLDLLQEILINPNFNQRDRIKQLLLEEKSQLEPDFISYGHAFAIDRSFAKLHATFDIQDKTTGLDYYLSLKDLINQIENSWDEVLENIQNIHSMLVNKNNLFINLTAPKSEWSSLKDNSATFIKTFPKNSSGKEFTPQEGKISQEAFVVAAPVNYVSQAFDTKITGYLPHGSMYVVSKILYTSYLWQKIRVEGGAYGGMYRFDPRTGLCGFTSYRDPNIEESLQTYNDAGSYLINLELTERELEGNIIGAIGATDPYLSPYSKAWEHMSWWLAGITPEIRLKRKKEILSTTIKDIKAFGEMMMQIPQDKKVIAILGNKEKIEQCADRLHLTIKDLL